MERGREKLMRTERKNESENRETMQKGRKGKSRRWLMNKETEITIHSTDLTGVSAVAVKARNVHA